MKKLLGLLILFFGFNAHCSDWLRGRWGGFCQMSVLEEDGSLIWNYEFSAKTGVLEIQKFEDNRCQKLKSATNRPFKLNTKPLGQSQTLAKIEFENIQAGQTSSAHYAFEKYGKNRMGLNAIYLLKQMGSSGKIETLIEDKLGFTKFPAQTYTRSGQ